MARTARDYLINDVRRLADRVTPLDDHGPPDPAVTADFAATVDPIYREFGSSAPLPRRSESPRGYELRVIGELQRQIPNHKPVPLSALAAMPDGAFSSKGTRSSPPRASPLSPTPHRGSSGSAECATPGRDGDRVRRRPQGLALALPASWDGRRPLPQCGWVYPLAQQDDGEMTYHDRADDGTRSIICVTASNGPRRPAARLSINDRARSGTGPREVTPVYSALSLPVPEPKADENAYSYRRRVVEDLKGHSPQWRRRTHHKSTDEPGFAVIERQVLAAAEERGLDPAYRGHVPPGQLRERKVVDASGNEQNGVPRRSQRLVECLHWATGDCGETDPGSIRPAALSAVGECSGGCGGHGAARPPVHRDFYVGPTSGRTTL